MFHPLEGSSNGFIVQIELPTMGADLHPLKRMAVIDNVLNRMFRGVYKLGVASGATPEEMVAGMNIQFQRIVCELGEPAFNEAGLMAAHYYNAFYVPQDEVV